MPGQASAASADESWRLERHEQFRCHGEPAAHVHPITKTGSVATAVWTAIPGTGYRLQCKTNLNAAAWGDLVGDVTASEAIASKADATLGTNATRFYRVVVVP